MNDFDSKLNENINKIVDLLSRIIELSEFNKQWGVIFEKLKRQTGKECTVRILNPFMYRTYANDKFQILISDFYSLLNGQIRDQKNSIIKNIRTNLRVFDMNHYYDPQTQITFIPIRGDQISEKERNSLNEKNRLSKAQKVRKEVIKCMKFLFPKIDDEFNIRESDHGQLKDKIIELAERLRSSRHVFDHKYEEMIVKEYLKKEDLINAQGIESVMKEYTDILSAISFIYHQCSYSFEPMAHYEAVISDVIDIILFGSIESALHRLGMTRNNMEEPFNRDMKRYKKSREIFYGSKDLLTIIVDH